MDVDMQTDAIKRLIYTLIQGFIFVLVIGINAQLAFCDAASDYAALKKTSLHLRNTDPHIRRASEWKEVISSLENFAAQDKNKGEAPSALLNAARMRVSISETTSDKEEISEAYKTLEKIADNYPDSTVADDALALLGDLYQKAQQFSEAKSYYNILIKRYPNSDLYEYALGKISIIDSNDTSAKPAHNQNSKGRGPVIVIDPGHGGEDLGAVGVSGLLEKDVVLDVAFELERILKDGLDARVLLTRKTDVFVPLQRRMEMANEAGADLFISLHTNASETKSLSGFESYFLDPEGDDASQLLAQRENASNGAEIDDISFMISDLIQASKIPESRALAESIQKATVTHLSAKWSGIKSLKVKKAPFYVLVGAHMPSVLIEMFFIDHAQDGERLAEKEFRKNIAHGILLGIKSYSAR